MKGKDRDRLLALCLSVCHEQNIPGWFQQHGSRLPKQLVTLIDHENGAETYSHVQPMLVPGLLQTGDYARTVISRIANVPAGEACWTARRAQHRPCVAQGTDRLD